MSDGPFPLSEGDRDRLRAVVVAIERQLACLSREATAGDHRSSLDELRASWAGLVELLALGAPDMGSQVPSDLGSDVS
jgi:hypothetical protein